MTPNVTTSRKEAQKRFVAWRPGGRLRATCCEWNVRHLGAPLEGEVVTLRDLATRREALRGRTVTAEGTVTFVCQEKGCFMEVEDDGVDTNVRVRDHAFSVPKDAAGRRARFSGRVLYLWEGKDTDAAHLPRAMIEIDATGVELR